MAARLRWLRPCWVRKATTRLATSRAKESRSHSTRNSASGCRHLIVQQGHQETEPDQDIDDIVDGLSDLLGPAVTVTKRIDVLAARDLRPRSGMRWFYASRSE
jgi:hypothetical protein